MNIELNEIDSRVFGRNVLTISDFDSASDFGAFERKYVKQYNPIYVGCKTLLEKIGDIHILERHNFNLIECQIQFVISLRKPFPTPGLGQYAFEKVSCEEDLKQVLEIAGKTFVDDRFSIDEAVPSEISGRRYKEYVLKSFQSPDEAVYRLFRRDTGQTVAFKTHLYRNSEVLFLLGGVHPAFKNLGIGPLSTYLEFNELIGKGFKKGITHISAANYAVFNLHITNLGFRVASVFGVMRKIYG